MGVFLSRVELLKTESSPPSQSRLPKPSPDLMIAGLKSVLPPNKNLLIMKTISSSSFSLPIFFPLPASRNCFIFSGACSNFHLFDTEHKTHAHRKTILF